MSNLPCDIEITIFGSEVVRKCNHCGTISSKGAEVPCEPRYEIDVQELQELVDALQEEIQGMEVEAKNEQDGVLLNLEHAKLRTILGLKQNSG